MEEDRSREKVERRRAIGGVARACAYECILYMREKDRRFNTHQQQRRGETEKRHGQRRRTDGMKNEREQRVAVNRD